MCWGRAFTGLGCPLHNGVTRTRRRWLVESVQGLNKGREGGEGGGVKVSSLSRGQEVCAVFLSLIRPGHAAFGFWTNNRFWFVRRGVALNWSVSEFVHLNCTSLKKFISRLRDGGDGFWTA